MFRDEFSLWFPGSMGTFVPFRYGSLLPEGAIGIFGYLGISGSAMAKALVILSIAFAGIGMDRLVSYVAEVFWKDKSKLCWLAGVLSGLMYMASPYQYNQIIAGDMYGLIAYAIIPFGIMFLWKWVGGNGSIAYGLMAGLTFASSLACSFQPTVEAGIIATLTIMIMSKHYLRSFARLVVPVMSAVGMLAFWILPSLSSGHLISTASSVSPRTVQNPSWYGSYDSVASAVMGTSYYVRFFTNGLSPFELWIWRGAIIIVLVGIAGSVSLLDSHGKNTQVRRLIVTWLAVLGVAVIFASPGSSLGWPVRQMYRLKVFALVFRTPQHLVFPISLAEAFLTGMTLLIISSYSRGHELCITKVAQIRSPVVIRMLQIMITASVVLVAAGFAESSTLPQYVGPHPMLKGELGAQRYLSGHGTSQSRALVLPGTAGEYYAPKGPGLFALDAGDDGNVIWGVHPPVMLETKWNPNVNARIVQRAISQQILDYPDTAAVLLSEIAVRYVEVTPYFSPDAGPLYGAWNPAWAVRRLSGAPDLRVVYRSGGFVIFENELYRGQVFTYIPSFLQSDPLGAMAVPTLISSMAGYSPFDQPVQVASSFNKFNKRASEGPNIGLKVNSVNSSGSDRGTVLWNYSKGLYSGVWNYFDTYPIGNWDLMNAHSANSLRLMLHAPAHGSYDASLIVVSSGAKIAIVTRVGKESKAVTLDTLGSLQFQLVPLGSMTLFKGNNPVDISAHCTGSCNLALIGMVGAKSPSVSSNPPCHVVNSQEVDSSAYNALLNCSKPGYIELADSYSSGWTATASINGMKSVTLEHIVARSFANGWKLPAGKYEVQIRFSLQDKLILGMVLSCFTVLVVVVVLVARFVYMYSNGVS